MKLDFSQFHDLMHAPFSPYCRSLYPHGWKAGIHHLRAEWEYRLRDRVRAPLHTLYLCRVGRHEIQVWYAQNPHDGSMTVRPACAFCPFEREPLPHEAERRPPFGRHRPTT